MCDTAANTALHRCQTGRPHCRQFRDVISIRHGYGDGQIIFGANFNNYSEYSSDIWWLYVMYVLMYYDDDDDRNDNNI